MAKHWPKRLAYLATGLGVAALIIWALRPTPLPVEVGQVEQGELQVTVDAEGKTRLRSRFVVAAPVAGRLNRIDLNPGDPVTANSIVARIDPLPLDSQVRSAQARLQELQAQRDGVSTQRPKAAALTQAEAEIRAAAANLRQTETRVERAEAALAQAQRDRQRAIDLAADGAISQQQREAAELEATSRARELQATQQEAAAAAAAVAVAQDALTILQAEQRDPDYLLDVYAAQIASITAELANLADEAARTDIRFPGNGQVLRVLQESARYVDAGTPLLEVGNPGSLELVIDVLSSDAVRIRPNQPVVIEQWGGDSSLQGQVRYVEPSAFTEVSALGVEEQRVNIIADFTPPTGTDLALGDGYRVDARIVVWAKPEALQVPLSALFRCGEEWCAFTVEAGRAKTQQVAIGQRSDLAAAVIDGLQVGDVVILHPTDQVEDGRRVTSR